MKRTLKPTPTDHCIRRMDERGLRTSDVPIIKYGVCENEVFLFKCRINDRGQG